VAASGTDLTITVSGQTTKVEKNAIASVSYIQEKPLSDSAEYMYQERFVLKVFDPELWPYLFRINAGFAVRIYDTSSQKMIPRSFVKIIRFRSEVVK
jgi:hypothetical protein